MFDTAELERLFPSIEEAEPKETYLSELDKMPPVAPEETMQDYNRNPRLQGLHSEEHLGR